MLPSAADIERRRMTCVAGQLVVGQPVLIIAAIAALPVDHHSFISMRCHVPRGPGFSARTVIPWSVHGFQQIVVPPHAILVPSDTP